MKKRVGIDARLINQTGVGTYTRNLLHFISELESDDIEFFIYLMKNDIDEYEWKDPNFIKRSTNSRWHSFQEQVFFWHQLVADNLDLMHFTYFSYPLLYRKPYIATIHDLTPLYFKTGRASTKNPLIYNIKYAGLTNTLTRQIHNAKAIITPTRYVKKQITQHFGEILSDKIETIYEGVDYELMKTAPNMSLLQKYGNNFFIYVGNFYPHKNVQSLIKAFSRIKGDEKLILVGPKDYFFTYIVPYITHLKQTNRIFFFNNPTRADSAFFYSHAKALIHPSLSEGFGLPIAEAIYFNLPIIASNIPVFKEILENHYISFNPISVDEITNAINFFLKTDKTETSYENILSKLSFERMAEKTLEL